MARDENNGSLSFQDRFFFATKRVDYKRAHQSARLHGQAMFWFNQKRCHVSRGYGDSLNMYAYDDASEFRYMFNKQELRNLIEFKRNKQVKRA